MAWPILEPGAVFIPNWHIDCICDHLQAATEGEFQRLIFNIPPGFMKSLIISVFWNAWEWGPADLAHLRYLTSSWSMDYATRDTRKTRDLIRSEWYQDLWGHRVKLVRVGERSFENTERGTREGRPFSGLTAGRGDRVTVDDPHSTETAESETERERTTRLFREQLPSRVNDLKKSIIAVIMQRLHEKDVTGEAIRAELGYHIVRLPMRYEPASPCRTWLHGKLFFEDPRTIEGELLFPARADETDVRKLEHALGSYATAAQLQQRPGPREGSMFKREWFEIVKAVPAGGHSVRAWDLASTKVDARRSPDPDWTAGIRMKRVNGVFYITHATRLREEAAGVERALKSVATQDAVEQRSRIRLPQDPGAAGKMLAASLIKALAGYDVHARPLNGDKATRATPFAAQAEAGNVKILLGSWNDMLLDELVAFPGGAHDDMVDACSDAFDELTNRMPAVSIAGPVRVD